MKKAFGILRKCIFARISLVCAVMLTCTSCDVMLLALDVMTALYDTSSYTYTGSGYMSGSLPSYSSGSSYTSSDSSDQWRNTYESIYDRYVRGFESDLRTLNLMDKGSNSYVQIKMNLRSRQKDMQRTRNEAAQKGVMIPASSYETMAL